MTKEKNLFLFHKNIENDIRLKNFKIMNNL